MGLKIEEKDLLRIKLQSALLDLSNERMTSLAWQEKNLDTTKALIAERKKLIQLDAQDSAKKLDELGQMLETKYGVEDEKQINWETGEIGEAPQKQPTEQGNSPEAVERSSDFTG